MLSAASTLTLSELTQAVAHDGVAIRVITKLMPAGGAADKVFPPTYSKSKQSLTKYALETRKVEGRDVQTVLLDSVASQANRLEEALLDGWRRGELKIPVIAVDFTTDNDLADLDQITTLQAPHRVADAIFRDAVDAQGTPFRQTAIGRACTDARPNNAGAMYQYCPTALLFGVWDSTGPKGGLGAKFQRVLVSEIVGYDVLAGVKTSSRIDPLGIEKGAGKIYQLKTDRTDWTPFAEDAAIDNGKPIEFSRSASADKKDKEKGKPSSINHGNVTPGIDEEAGGVTMSYAIHTVVLSLSGIRRLRFQRRQDGTPFSEGDRDAAEVAARTALTALGLAAVIYQQRNGYDLRSRSVLVAAESPVFELLHRDGREPRHFMVEDAASLLDEALEAAQDKRLGWHLDRVTLTPTPKLVHLIKESRKLKAAGEADEEEVA